MRLELFRRIEPLLTYFSCVLTHLSACEWFDILMRLQYMPVQCLFLAESLITVVIAGTSVLILTRMCCLVTPQSCASCKALATSCMRACVVTDVRMRTLHMVL